MIKKVALITMACAFAINANCQNEECARVTRVKLLIEIKNPPAG